jgi:hypothetical protein
MIYVDIYDYTMKFIARIACPFEYEMLVESLQYNGYTCQVIENDRVLNTILAK